MGHLSLNRGTKTMWFFFESYIHVVQHLICQFGLIWTMQIYNQQQREGKLQN